MVVHFLSCSGVAFSPSRRSRCLPAAGGLAYPRWGRTHELTAANRMP